MNNTNLAIRFTDEVYATRQDVARALGTNLIDSIWHQILEYRKGFSKTLSLLDVNKSVYAITFTNDVLEKNKRLSERFLEAEQNYRDFADRLIEKEVFSNDMFKSELRYLAHLKGIIVNDIALNNIISNRSTDLLYLPLVNYLSALKSINVSTSIDENLLAGYLQTLNGGEALTKFYRQTEIENPSQKVLINREYLGAPTALIEKMMSNLFAFLNDERNDLIVRLSATLYMFNYVKPFDNYNDELALLVCKTLLLKNHNKDFVTLLPLEIVFYEGKDNLASSSKDSQRSRDLTYYHLQILRLFEDTTASFISRIIQITRDSLESETFSNEIIKEPEHATPIQGRITSEVSDKPEEKVIVPSSKKEEKLTPIMSNNEPVVNVHAYQDLDEKALNRAAIDLMERDPNLRPGQAHFYVRHCTIGKYYTIQQYKKAERCVYETARTSMDYLAKAGYYRREQVKNKFVYTPISK